MSKPTKLDTKLITVILIIIAFIIAVFVLTPSRGVAIVLLILSVFIFGLILGAQSNLQIIRRMTDSPKSTIRGAAQGNVELVVTLKAPEDSPYREIQEKEQKGYWCFSIRKTTRYIKTSELIHEFKSHQDYLPLYEHDTVCYADLDFVEFHPKTHKVMFKGSELPKYEKKFPVLTAFQQELNDAETITFEQEWLPLETKIFGIGYFSSSPSNLPPNELNRRRKEAWLKIAMKAEGIVEEALLKGTMMINTLTMSKFGTAATPVILSIFSERRLKNKVWFKFWMCIFLLMLFLSVPVLYILDQN